MSLQKALAALQHALFPDDECEGAVAHVAAGQGPAASAASCTPDGAELCGALHGVTQALSSGLHCLPDSQLLLQQLQEGRGWQLLLSACEAKGTQRTSQRAWQSGAAAAREAGGCGCSCSCALAALSAALQLALAGGRGLTPNSNAGHCGDQQQQVQVQEQEQQGGEPEGCRVRAPWLPPPFVLPRLVSMSSTNLAAAHCTGSSSNGSSDSSSDMSLATGVLELLLRAAHLPRGREWLLSGHAVSTAGDRSSASSASSSSSSSSSSSYPADGAGRCIAARHGDARQLQDSSGVGSGRPPAQCGCGVCQLACQAATVADLLLSLAASGGNGTEGPSPSKSRPLGGSAGSTRGDVSSGGSSNGGAAVGLGLEANSTSLAACLRLASATLASVLLLPLPPPPRHEEDSHRNASTASTTRPNGESGGTALLLQPAAGRDQDSASMDRWRQHGPAVAAWVAASRGRPLLSLLHLHAALSLTHSGSGNAAQGQATSAGTPAASAAARAGAGRCGGSDNGSRGSADKAQGGCCTRCCCVSKMVLAAVETVCVTAPAAVAAEVAAGQLGERSVRAMLNATRAELRRCPSRLSPRLGPDGRVSTFSPDGLADADPCPHRPLPPPPAPRPPHTGPPSRNTDSSTNGTWYAPAELEHVLKKPLAAAALAALAALCGSSRRGARLAAAGGALDVLEGLRGRVTRGSALGRAAERVYGKIARQSKLAADDLCEGSDVWGLLCAMMPAEQHGAANSTLLRHAVPQAVPATHGKAGALAAPAAYANLLPAEAAAATSASSAASGGAGCPCCSSLDALYPTPASPTPLQVRAASRMCMLLDACSADDFALLCSGRRQTTITTSNPSSDAATCSRASSSTTMTSLVTATSFCGSGTGTGIGAPGSCPCGSSSTSAADPRAPLDVALHWMGWRDVLPANMGVVRQDARSGEASGCAKVGGSGQQLALYREAAVTGARLLLGCLERARRTGWLKVPSQPAPPPQQQHVMVGRSGSAWQGSGVQCVAGLRGGFWEGLRAGEVAGMEAWARRVLATGGSVGAAAEPEPCGAVVPNHPEERDRLQGSKGSPQDAASAGTARGGEASGQASKGSLVISGGGGGGAPASSTTGGVGGGGGDEAEYDEDGLRTVWDSGPARHVAAARAAWRDVPLRERVSWTQTSTDVTVTLTLPPGTRKGEVVVGLHTDRLVVRLGWCGRVVDGPLHRAIRPQDSVWTLADGNTLQVLLCKAEAGRWWRALFQGGEEKGFHQILADAVHSDEPVVPYDQMDEGAKELLEELLERQAAIVDGSFDLENSFDDFRLALGDNNL